MIDDYCNYKYVADQQKMSRHNWSPNERPPWWETAPLLRPLFQKLYFDIAM